MSCEHEWEEVKRYKELNDAGDPAIVYTTKDVEYNPDKFNNGDYTFGIKVEYKCALCDAVEYETLYVDWDTFNSLDI